MISGPLAYCVASPVCLRGQPVVTTAGKKPREGTCVVRQRDALRRRLLGSYDAAALIADKGQPWLHRVVAARLRSIPAAVLGDDSSVGTCDTRPNLHKLD